MKATLLLITLMLLLCTPLYAQEVTQEAVQDTPQETAVPVESSPISPLLQVAIGASLILVSVSIAFEKLGNRAKAATNNAFEMKALETAGDNVPLKFATLVGEALTRVTTALENVTEAWKKATDHVPESSKPVIVGVNTSPESLAKTASNLSYDPSATADTPQL